MRCFGSSSRQKQHRCAASRKFSRAMFGSKGGCTRLESPFRQLAKPFRACLGLNTEPLEVNHQASHASMTLPAESILVAKNKEPTAIDDQPVIKSAMSVGCTASSDTQILDGCSSPAGNAVSQAEAQPLSPNNKEAAPAAPRLVSPPQEDNRASAHLGPLLTDESMGVLSECTFSLVDTPDSPDYQALLAEALARLCRRVSEDGYGQTADQQLDCCSHASPQHRSGAAPPAAVARDMSDSSGDQAAVAEALARLCRRVSEEGQGQPASQAVAMSDQADEHKADATMSAAIPLNLCAVAGSLKFVDHQGVDSSDTQSSSDIIADAVSDVLTAMVDAIVSSEVQHAAVDQAVDELLAEVCAAVEPIQLSMPAGSPTAKHMASLAAISFADSHSLSMIPKSYTPEAQPWHLSSQYSSTTPQGQRPQLHIQLGTTTAANLVTSQEQRPVASSNGKENVSVVKAGLPIKTQEQGHARAGLGSLARGRQGWHDGSAFQLMATAVPTELAQVSLMESKLAELGCGPAHQTILALPPTPTSALPLVLRVCTGNTTWDSGECSSVAQEALLMYTCAHPNVVPITILGLRAPLSPLTPHNHCQVAYFGMPLADISLQKRLGQQAWGRSSWGCPAYQGPSLLTLVKYAQAILKALAHTHSCRVLHRGLTPDHVLLFSRAGQEAEGEVRRATKPAAIKHSVRLAGFGAATKLSGRGVALHPSPYRCAEGYVPPEARQNSPLTTAADVYQLGGLCYFMAFGCHPPASLNLAPLPDYVPQEWRLVVSQCRAINPSDRPTVAQLQLHLLGLCQHINQGPKSPSSSAKLVPAKLTGGASLTGPSHRLSSLAMNQEAPATTVAAIAESAIVPSTMASNPFYASESRPSNSLYASESRPPKRSSTDHKPTPAALAQTPPLTAATRAAVSGVRSQLSLASAASALGSLLKVPRLMQGVDNWLPEETITFVGHSQGSTLSSHAAAQRRQQSVADPDADTAAAGNDRAVMHLLRLAAGSIAAVHDKGGAEATCDSMGIVSRGSDAGSQAGCAERQHLSGQTSEASEILHAVASSHQAPARLCSSPEPADFGNISASSSASGKQAALVSVTQDRAKTGSFFNRTPSTSSLIMFHRSAEHDRRQIEAADMGQLGSSPRWNHTPSPKSQLLPRRDDSALEKPSTTGWMAQAQGKAAGFAASVSHRASEVAEQTSALLQHWSASQLSTTCDTPPVSRTVTTKMHLLPPTSGRGSSIGVGSILAHSIGLHGTCS